MCDGTVLDDEFVKTRKQHRCFGCTRRFPVGSTLRRQTSVDSDGIQTTYMCTVCLKVHARNAEAEGDDCFYYGDLREFHEWSNVLVEVTYNRDLEVAFSE